MPETWLEHQIHNNDEDDEDKHFLFHLFDQGKEEEYETMNFEFPNVHKITIQSQTQCETSTGLALWLGSEMLCEYLSKHSELVKGKHVLELGSGVGLCGIMCHHLGASKVLLTDGDSSVLKVLQRNIQTNTIPYDATNASAIQCQQLVWGKNLNEFDNEKFNVILAADCLYMKTSVKPLFETVHQLLSNDGVLIYIMVSASQSPVEYVHEVASSFSLEWELDGDSVYLFRRAKNA